MPGDSLPRNRTTSAFERRIGRALAPLSSRHREDGAGERGPVLVAASGGPDSTAVLVATARALGAGSSVVAAHFDHHLRPLAERRREQAVVDHVAGALGVTVVSGAARAGGERSEAAAREARYRWLARVCHDRGARWCVTGHTLDDQAETVLMRLVRGAGTLGASGMAPVAAWPVAARGSSTLQVARPFLQITRAEVERYLAALGIETAQDPSNTSLDYARNRVRHAVLPELLQVNARAREHLAAFAESSRADESLLSALARDWLREHAPAPSQGPARVYELPRGALRQLPAPIALRVIRDAALALGLPLEATHLVAVQAILGRSGAHVDLSGGSAETTSAVLRIAAVTP